MDSFRERIKYCREVEGMTQKEVADFLKISPRAYQRYESGDRKPSYDVVLKLCRLYGVSTDFLFGMVEIEYD